MSRRLNLLLQKAREIISEGEEEIEIGEPSIEIHVFDFDTTLHHNYKPLQCVDVMKQHQQAGIPCYIVTAREPNKGQEAHIKDTCKRWGININQKDIFCTGENNPKGPVVRSLIDRHQAEFCTFWDDKDYNCESVYDSCFDACEELKVYWLSAAVPGDIRKEIISGPDNERVETKPTLQERRLFRNWRKLSGL